MYVSENNFLTLSMPLFGIFIQIFTLNLYRLPNCQPPFGKYLFEMDITFLPLKPSFRIPS